MSNATDHGRGEGADFADAAREAWEKRVALRFLYRGMCAKDLADALDPRQTPFADVHDLLERCLDLVFLGLQIRRHLVGHEHRDLIDQLLELLLLRVDVPQKGHLVLQERVVDHRQVRKVVCISQRWSPFGRRFLAYSSTWMWGWPASIVPTPLAA